MHDQKLVEQAKIFVQLENQLLSKGYKKKISQATCIFFPQHFPALSTKS
jgi:hypothetical protein